MIVKSFVQLFFFLFISNSFAGSVKGVVTDKETGEPLLGVNVFVEGTSLRTITNVAGKFIIEDIPPGKHIIVFSFIGYEDVWKKNVAVISDSTVFFEIEMKPATIEPTFGLKKPLPDGWVLFEEPLDLYTTNTTRLINSGDIEKLPVRGIDELVSLNSGVTTAGSGGLTGNTFVRIRGTLSNQSLFQIDGIPYLNPLTGEPFGTIPNFAIDDIETQIGGFPVRYGNSLGGVVNTSTNTGYYRYFGGAEGITSGLTDAYGYNLFSGYVGGPLLPKSRNLTFFAVLEKLNAADDYPRAIKLEIPTAGISRDQLQDNQGDVLRFSGNIRGYFGHLKTTISASGSFRDYRDYIHSYAKHNSFHNPKLEDNVMAGAFDLEHALSHSAFWTLTLRYQSIEHKEGDGFWYEDVLAYGDSAKNAEVGVQLPRDGTKISYDENGVFYDYGRVYDFFGKYEVQTPGVDFKLVKAVTRHLFEIGGSFQQSTLRYYTLSPVVVAYGKDIYSLEERYYRGIGRYYGYDITGEEELNDSRMQEIAGITFEESGAKKPQTAWAYLQDQIDFRNLKLNLGLRYDFFDPKTDRIKDPENVLGFGTNPTRLDVDDFEKAPSENYFSPRLGAAFLLSYTTTLRANYGIYRRQPPLFTIYESWLKIKELEVRNGEDIHHGHVKAETSTQYELGIQKQIDTSVSVDFYLYYNQIKDIINLAVQRTKFGPTYRRYTSYTNIDNSLTVKGAGASVYFHAIGPFNGMINYTFTSSSQEDASSNFIGMFQNPNLVNSLTALIGNTPKHVVTADLDFRTAKGEGPAISGFRPLENTGANMLLKYHSGGFYTPIEQFNVLGNTDLSETIIPLINPATSDPFFQIDLKIDKRFDLKKVSLVPYLWIRNLLGRKNVTYVYPSTGQPNNTGYLETPEGQQQIIASPNPEGFVADYKALENNPENYDFPRLIRLGLKIKF